MSGVEERVARVLALSRRLSEMLLADIAALDRGKPGEMRSILPETQQLLAQYAREAQALKNAMRTLSPALRAKLTAATAELNQALALHERRLTRVRNATEGMIRAVAEDVEKKRRITRPYGRTQTARSAGPMLYNSTA